MMESVSLAWFLQPQRPEGQQPAWIIFRRVSVSVFPPILYSSVRATFPHVIFSVIQITLERVIKFNIVEPWMKSNKFSKID